MSHRCIYCNHKFDKNQAEQERIAEVVYYRCPNKAEDEEGRALCGKRLPMHFLDADTTVISIVGSSGVGKTYFLLALLLNLKYNRSLNKIGLRGDIVGEESVNKAVNELLEQANKKIKLDATAIGAASRAVLEIALKKKKKAKYIYLSLNDNPGEVFMDRDKMITNLSPVLSESDGVIFLIDPQQLPINYVQNGNDQTADLFSVLNNTIQLLRYIQEHRSSVTSSNPGWSIWKEIVNRVNNSPKQLPVAFVISKFDQMRNRLHNEIPDDAENLEDLILMNSDLNESYFNSVSNELELIIGDAQDGDPRVADLLNESDFSYSFLASSSGYIDNDKFVFRPQGVSLPLIWILRKLNKL